jgi:hypothetical protein
MKTLKLSALILLMISLSHTVTLRAQLSEKNGNVGIGIPPDSTSQYIPVDQLQVGGGVVPDTAGTYPTVPIPGLTIYGGNALEGTLNSMTGHIYPYDSRYIAFNNAGYHHDSVGAGHRVSAMPSTQISFSEVNGGTLNLSCSPVVYDTGVQKDLVLEMTGQQGLQMWSDESATGGDPFHHLFDVYRPGYLTWGVTRNTNGLFFHRTPVYIGSDSSGNPSADFTDLTNVHPSYGDGETWMLAVNGAALAKEFYVSTDWPDFVFDPGYTLPGLTEVERYIKANHHLPGVPPAKEIDTTGVPLGKTEATMMKKIEELTLYTIELNKEVEALKADLQDLKNQKER